MAARACRTTSRATRQVAKAAATASAQELGGAARAQGTRRGRVDTARAKKPGEAAEIERVSEQLILFQLSGC